MTFSSQPNLIYDDYDDHCLSSWPTLSAGAWWRMVTTE